jgi:hypothetical protein
MNGTTEVFVKPLLSISIDSFYLFNLLINFLPKRVWYLFYRINLLLKMVDSDKRLFIQDIDSLVFINSIPFNLVDLLVNVVKEIQSA